jgi:NADH:ubiquinone oxidoreductase subunit 4 (subunit M)
MGEFLIAGSFKVNSTVTFFWSYWNDSCGCYALWLFNRIAFGNLKVSTKTNLDI